jgi:polysaccharide biosynthesis/export protein
VVRSFSIFLVFSSAFLLTSCGAYKQNLMFRTDEGKNMRTQAELVESNYTIARNDQLLLEVYTNKGETLVDPNRESFSQPAATTQSAAQPIQYLVDVNGKIKFPLIDELSIEGLTLRQAEAVLQKEYSKYYEEPYVVLKYANKRVVILGAPGGQVIPLANENVRLTEVLAMAKGIAMDAKAKNIRVLRGEKVFIADFSTFEGYLRDNIVIKPGDIVYIEPVRRPFMEAVREYGSIVSIITSLGTLVIILIQTNN